MSGPQVEEEAAQKQAPRVRRDQPELPLSDGARAVLSAAAGWARPAQTSLSAGLVLVTMAELGGGEEKPSWAGGFLAQALRQRPGWREARAHYLERKKLSPELPREGAEPGNMTGNLRAVMKAATAIARATAPDGPLSARHLLAALLEDHPSTGALSLLREVGIAPAELRAQLLTFLLDGGDRDEAWRQILGPPPILPAYFADDTRGRDLLSIDGDVVALARLIAAREVTPPLSIGLFGEWGSGKTFFMRQLRREVGQLARVAAESKRMQRELPYFKRIVQIEFNAWHYLEGNLWASLVEHIFDNLHLTDDQDDRVTRRLQEHYLKKLRLEETAKIEASRAEQQAQDAVKVAETDLNKAKEARDAKLQETERLTVKSALREFSFPKVMDQLRPLLARLGLDTVNASAVDLHRGLTEAEAVVRYGGGVLAPLFHSRDRARRWLTLVGALAAGPGLTWLVGFLLVRLGKAPLGDLQAIGTTSGTVIAAMVAWLTRQRQWMNRALKEVGTVQERYDAELREALADNERQIKAAESALQLLNQSYTTAKQKHEEAAKRVEEAQKQLNQATSVRLLASFIQDRAASADYRKHLGVLALIREDFETLSGLIEDDNWKLAPARPQERPRGTLTKFETLAEEEAEQENRISRIVLYIDDLDRCPPARVVEVLQAVHLLLAFPLFVVVVGVDARWVKRALGTQYRHLLRLESELTGDAPLADTTHLIGRATADDYLEKIFQIPLWLRSMDEDGCKRMVAGLLEGSVIRRGGDGTGSRGSTGGRGGGAGGERRDGGAPRPPARDDELLGGGPLEITETEAVFMDELAPLLGRSPRALKRYVNVFRLIKAGLTAPERQAFAENEGRVARTVLFLLAVDTGTPGAWEPLRTLLAASRTWSNESELGSQLRTSADTPDVKRVSDWLQDSDHQPFLCDDDKQLEEWLARVARFSFAR